VKFFNISIVKHKVNWNKITEGLNPTRSVYLCLKDERNIPLTPVQPTSISDLEEEGLI
jgi:hypothetical protein